MGLPTVPAGGRIRPETVSVDILYRVWWERVIAQHLLKRGEKVEVIEKLEN